MYTETGKLDREILLRQHAPLVRRIAHHILGKLPPNIALDDLIQVGMIGLNDTLTRYDITQGVRFETFAARRIRGAMLDTLREGDWMSRSARKSQKDIEQALHRLEQKLGRSPRESEIAAELGLTLADYQSLLGKVRGTQLVYLEDLHGSENDAEAETEGYLARHNTGSPVPPPSQETPDEQADPQTLLREQRMRAALIAAIDSLPERERHIMAMYYEHEMTLKEIAAVLGVTESRICQLHSQAIARLRVKMREH